MDHRHGAQHAAIFQTCSTSHETQAYYRRLQTGEHFEGGMSYIRLQRNPTRDSNDLNISVRCSAPFVGDAAVEQRKQHPVTAVLCHRNGPTCVSGELPCSYEPRQDGGTFLYINYPRVCGDVWVSHLGWAVATDGCLDQSSACTAGLTGWGGTCGWRAGPSTKVCAAGGRAADQ